MIFAFGNPTRSEGKFFRINFGSDRNRWKGASIDSRLCRLPNHALHDEWIADFGVDSDYCRVRILGLPPLASSLQFIDAARVLEAQKRPVHRPLQGDALICGIDVARGGADSNVIRFRRGRDARSIPAIRIPGEETRNTSLLVTKIADLLMEHRPEATFLDATGIGGPIGDRLRQLGFKVTDTHFGGSSPDPKCENRRAFMWSRLRDWLETGCIEDGSKESGRRLEIDLTGPQYSHNKQDRIVLESKEEMKRRGLDSPDDGDALAMTFAMPVISAAVKRERQRMRQERRYQSSGGTIWS